MLVIEVDFNRALKQTEIIVKYKSWIDPGVNRNLLYFLAKVFVYTCQDLDLDQLKRVAGS